MEVAVRKNKRQSTGVTTMPNSSTPLPKTVHVYGMTRNLGGGKQEKTALSMYADPPQHEITLDQFERSGVDRLQGEERGEIALHMTMNVSLAPDYLMPLLQPSKPSRLSVLKKTSQVL